MPVSENENRVTRSRRASRQGPRGALPTNRQNTDRAFKAGEAAAEALMTLPNSDLETIRDRGDRFVANIQGYNTSKAMTQSQRMLEGDSTAASKKRHRDLAHGTDESLNTALFVAFHQGAAKRLKRHPDPDTANLASMIIQRDAAIAGSGRAPTGEVGHNTVEAGGATSRGQHPAAAGNMVYPGTSMKPHDDMNRDAGERIVEAMTTAAANSGTASSALSSGMIAGARARLNTFYAPPHATDNSATGSPRRLRSIAKNRENLKKRVGLAEAYHAGSAEPPTVTATSTAVSHDAPWLFRTASRSPSPERRLPPSI